MKTSIDLTEQETSQAVAEYLAKKGFKADAGMGKAIVEKETVGYGPGEHEVTVFRCFRMDGVELATPQNPA